MSDSQDPKISVELEAVLGKLSADLKAAEAMTAKTTATMTQTVAREAAKSAAASGAMNEQNAKSLSDQLRSYIRIAASISLARGALSLVTAGTQLWRGETENVEELIAKLPFGIGALGMVVKEVMWEFSGLNKEIAESLRLTTEIENSNKAIADKSLGRSQLEKLKNELAAANAGSPGERQAIMLAEAERKAKEQQRKDINDGVSPEVAAETMRVRVQLEQKKISEAYYAEERTRSQAIQRLQEQESEMRKRMAEEESAAIAKTKRDAIDALIMYEREQISAMQEEMGKLGRINGGNFITSGSSALGTFSSAQSNGSRIVAESSRRQVELQQAILNTSIAIKDLMATKDGWN